VGIEDLQSLVTMGFRGEALPSIAAVSRLALVTRAAGQAFGFRIDVVAALAEAEGEVGAPPGTQLEVRDLFHNVPARLKFLKADATESAHVSDMLVRLALARPEVHFTLAQEGRTALDLPGSGDGMERAQAVLGRRVRRLYRALGGEAGVKVEAFLAAPDESATTQRGVYLFVNRRFVKDRNLAHALVMGFGELVPRGRQPVAVVHVTMPEVDVDVNVHPQKTEVRFRAPQEVYAAVRHTVARTCAGAPWLADQGSAAARLSVYTLPPSERSEREPDAAAREAVRRYFQSGAAPMGGRRPARPAEQAPLFSAAERAPQPTQVGPAEPVAVAAPRGDADVFFASLGYIGQLHGTYLVCQAEGELVLIDQHAAHERVVFQRLRGLHERRDVRSQRLLFPQVIPVDEALAATAAEHASTLAALGFEVEAFGSASLAVNGMPEEVARAAPRELLVEILGELGARASTEVLADRIDHVLATMACHSVIRAGDPVSPAQARALLDQMDGIDYRMHCPHGRPVLLRMRMDEIERRFGRT
jgi:DNA mismatch repair protein MutL